MSLFKDYFHDTPTYTEQQFRRRFRMSKPLFLRIVDRLSNHMVYFQPTHDATGRASLSPLQKCTAAIRMLAYGCAADAVDEYVRIGASTARLCLEHFVEGVISCFGDEYLRRPTPLDIQRLLYVGELRGFPGMLGSIDCMHWGWKNCPVAWQGQYSRGDKAGPTIVLEAVASYDLWIWHAFFGTPGTCNDINVLDRSPVFDDIFQGRAPPVKYTVNGNEYELGYYLVDGIYPPWATFIPAVTRPVRAKDVVFTAHQESARKDVERAFGVLQSRFAIIRYPALVWDITKIAKIMRACIILHNMIVEDGRDRDMANYQFMADFEQRGESGATPVESSYTKRRPDYMKRYIESRTRVRDRASHKQLKSDLVEHIWGKFGNQPNEDAGYDN